MSAQRRPATKRDASGSGSRRAGSGSRSGGSAARAASVPREEGTATIAASGGAVASAPSPRPATPPAPRPAKPATPKGKEQETKSGALAERTGRIRKIFDDTRAEMKKITWPDRETTRNLTIVVIGISIALGILLGGMDYVLFQLFEALP